MKKKVVPTLQQEVKLKVDIVTSDDIRIYYTGKFQDFTARYIIKYIDMLATFYIDPCVLTDAFFFFHNSDLNNIVL